MVDIVGYTVIVAEKPRSETSGVPKQWGVNISQVLQVSPAL